MPFAFGLRSRTLTQRRHPPQSRKPRCGIAETVVDCSPDLVHVRVGLVDGLDGERLPPLDEDAVGRRRVAGREFPQARNWADGRE